ncbi:hypothetical protein CgS9114_02378 [Corynebacterium glutamicum S9114]|nr:hypothetical protein CgS9114_02378 [Corynebacterium glutamicum S9114]
MVFTFSTLDSALVDVKLSAALLDPPELPELAVLELEPPEEAAAEEVAPPDEPPEAALHNGFGSVSQTCFP